MGQPAYQFGVSGFSEDVNLPLHFCSKLLRLSVAVIAALKVLNTFQHGMEFS
jgi:hypothetical protein